MVTTQAQAQELLDAGWQLLGLFDRRDGNDQYAEYHLGKGAEERQCVSAQAHARLIPCNE